MSDNSALLSRPPVPPLRRFLVWGFVLNSTLPLDLELPHVRIKYMDDAEYARMRRSHTVLEHPDIKDRPNRTSVAADIRIRSRWAILVWVDAPDTESAHRAAADDYIPPVVALLSCITADPVDVDVVRIVELDAPDSEDATPVTPWSRSSFYRIAEPQPLPAEDQEELRRLLTATRNDRVAREAAAALSSAIETEPLTGGTSSNMEAVLLRYFFVVEGISKHIGYDRGAQQRMDAAREDLINEARRQLAKRGTPQYYEKQIRGTVRKLDVLVRKFLPDQIKHAGQMLQVPPALIDEAVSFMHLRNSRLGHAGKSEATGDELRGWLERARPIAFAFMLGYARALVKACNHSGRGCGWLPGVAGQGVA